MDGLARNEKLVKGVDKISRSLFEAIEKLDDGALEAALGEEMPGVPLLGPKALEGVKERKTKLLAQVRTKRDPFVFP